MRSDRIGTLPDVRPPEKVRADRNRRRVGLAVLLVVVLAGLAGLLGVRTATVTASGGGVDAELRYAAVTRAGLATPYHLTVERAGGFDGPVVVAVSRELFDRFDFQSFYPEPARESADGDFVVFELDPPDGDVLTWTFDVKTAPNQLWSADEYRTQVRDGAGGVLVELRHRMVVFP